MSKSKPLTDYKLRQQEIFHSLSNKLMAISSPVRLKLIHFLSQAPLSVEVLAEKIEQSVANTSMHLRKMLGENIVSVQQLGQKRIYALDPSVINLWEHCQDFLGQLEPSMTDLLDSTDNMMNWTKSLPDTAIDLIHKKIALVDIRPNEEISLNTPFKDIPYFHIPFDRLNEEYKKLPKKIPILVICRGKYCALSTQAVSQLKKHNLKVYRMPHSWFAIHTKIKELL